MTRSQYHLFLIGFCRPVSLRHHPSFIQSIRFGNAAGVRPFHPPSLYKTEPIRQFPIHFLPARVTGISIRNRLDQRMECVKRNENPAEQKFPSIHSAGISTLTFEIKRKDPFLH